MDTIEKGGGPFETALNVTVGGHLTLRPELLARIDVGPADRVRVTVSPDGSLRIAKAEKTGTARDLVGILHDPETRPLAPDDMTPMPREFWDDAG